MCSIFVTNHYYYEEWKILCSTFLLQHTYIYFPMDTCIVNLLSLMKPKLVLTGEGANSETFDALMSLFEESNTDSPVSTR